MPVLASTPAADASRSHRFATAEAGRPDPTAAVHIISDSSPSHTRGVTSATATTMDTTRRTKRSKRTANKPRAAVFSKRKGVYYREDGEVLSCRFCEILRERDEPFLYEDDRVAVFRPLRPIVASHILIVPRAHIRNIRQLSSGHDELLRHMQVVADSVLRAMSQQRRSASGDCAVASVSSTSSGVAERNQSSSDPLAASSSDIVDNDALSLEPDPPRSGESSKCTDDDEDSCGAAGSPTTTAVQPALTSPFKFAFHVPPFNSIDHVHMHAFRDERMGVFGRVKYRTESWWCRSVADVLARLTPSDSSSPSQQQEDPVGVVADPADPADPAALVRRTAPAVS